MAGMPERFPRLIEVAAFTWMASFLLATAAPFAVLAGQIVFVREAMVSG